MGISTEALRELYALVRSLDPNHPVPERYGNPNITDGLLEATTSSLSIPIRYPKSLSQWSPHELTLPARRSETATKCGRYYRRSATRTSVNGWGWKREPTEAELRAMTWLAVVHGVQGIFYYTYHGSRYFIRNPRPLGKSKAGCPGIK